MRAQCTTRGWCTSTAWRGARKEAVELRLPRPMAASSTAEQGIVNPSVPGSNPGWSAWRRCGFESRLRSMTLVAQRQSTPRDVVAGSNPAACEGAYKSQSAELHPTGRYRPGGWAPASKPGTVRSSVGVRLLCLPQGSKMVEPGSHARASGVWY